MATKLILVEGLPSTGKTTTAKIVHEILNERNISNEIFFEGNLDHPADYDGVAFFNGEDHNKLIKDYTFVKDKIDNISIKKESGYFVEYKRAWQKDKDLFPKELWNMFFRNDIYELPLALHMQLIKEKWSEFANIARNEDKIYIFDCPFIQNPVTATMIRDNASQKTTIDYIKELEKIIIDADLNPILLYVDQKDIQSSFQKAVDERPKEWLDFFIDYYTNQGYGKQHVYDGLGGVKEILLARQRLEYEILNALEINTNIIDNSEFHYQKYKTKIKRILFKIRIINFI